MQATTHRYILQPYKGKASRCTCPSCGTKHVFTLYIDTETGQPIADHVGRCERVNNCGYHYTPKQFFADNPQQHNSERTKGAGSRSISSKTAASTIPFETFAASLKGYEANNFATYLKQLFGIGLAESLVSKYFVGTSNHWQAATVFWQIDISGKVRAGKIMLYNPETGKRIKEPFNHIHWVHAKLKLQDFELRQCFFGEHLLRDNSLPIAIVESEKTAVIASVYLPQFVWLAAGSLTNLNAEKCAVLKGKDVTLFPDLKGFEVWNEKAEQLAHIAPMRVSSLLEQKASNAERASGLDLADYLVRHSFIEFKAGRELNDTERQLLFVILENRSDTAVQYEAWQALKAKGMKQEEMERVIAFVCENGL